MKYRSNPRFLAAAVSIAAMLAVLAPAKQTLAAGGAFAVDDAGVDAPGDCKIEAFSSFARNNDHAFVVAPACVVSLGRPVEVGAEIERARSAANGEPGSHSRPRPRSCPSPKTQCSAWPSPAAAASI
jgi:hypothetical protein